MRLYAFRFAFRFEMLSSNFKWYLLFVLIALLFVIIEYNLICDNIMESKHFCSRGEKLLRTMGINMEFNTAKSVSNSPNQMDTFLDDCLEQAKIQDLIHEGIELANESVCVDVCLPVIDLVTNLPMPDIDVENISTVEDEGTCARFLAYSETHKMKASKSDSNCHHNKRRNCCPYCNKVVTNFMRHVTGKHLNEDKVKEYLSVNDSNLNERKRRKQKIANEIRAEGNYKHNSSIINGSNNYELLPVKRPSKNLYKVSQESHISCKYCLGFFKKETFYQHLRSCNNFKTSTVQCESRRMCIRTSGEILVPSSPVIDSNLKEKVFPTMFKDKISFVAQNDPLILKFGSRFYLTHQEKHQIKYVSCKMRDLARLCISVKNLNPVVKNMADCLIPSNFDYLMEAVRIMCGYNKNNGICEIPSITPRLRSSLVACADIIRLEAIKNPSFSDSEKKEVQSTIDDFMYLLNREWAIQVSANAEKSRRLSKVSKVDILPDSNDIKIFCSYLNKQCDIIVKDLQRIPTDNNYEKLTKIVIAYLITLNRRRPGEVVNATLKCYRTLNENEDFGMLEETVLSKEDIETCEKLSIFYIPANKNRKKVPVLLTKKLKNAIDVLIDSREKLNISSELLFPRPHSNSLYDGTEIITDLKNKLNLRKPVHFTATGLRHHAATSTQLHSKNDNYTRSLAKFLGHTLETHKGYYEMPLPLIQKVLVGKQLMEMTCENQDENVNQIEMTSENLPDSLENSELKGREFESNNVEQKCIEDIERSSGKSTSKDSDYSCKQYSDSSCNSFVNSSPVKKSKKVRWNKEEKEIIYKSFGKYFLLNQNPRRSEIKDVWEVEPLLKTNRTLQQVCTYVNNIVNNKTKIPTPDKNRIRRKYM